MIFRKRVEPEEKPRNPYWYLKDNCPVCVSQFKKPNAPLYRLTLGQVQINLCEQHAIELYEALKDDFKADVRKQMQCQDD